MSRVSEDVSGRMMRFHTTCTRLADFIGTCKARIVQVAVQPFDLLRQRHLEEADFDLGFFLPTKRQQSRKSRGRDAVGQGNARSTMEAVG